MVLARRKSRRNDIILPPTRHIRAYLSTHLLSRTSKAMLIDRVASREACMILTSFEVYYAKLMMQR